MNQGVFIFHPTMIDFRFIELYNIFCNFLQSSKMYLILSGNIDLYYLISNKYFNMHFITLYVSESWIVGFSNYQVIDALANNGVAPIGQEQVLSKAHFEVWGKVEKNAISSRTFGISSSNFWVICGRKYHKSPKSYYRKFRKFAKKLRFFQLFPILGDKALTILAPSR